MIFLLFKLNSESWKVNKHYLLFREKKEFAQNGIANRICNGKLEGSFILKWVQKEWEKAQLSTRSLVTQAVKSKPLVISLRQQ